MFLGLLVVVLVCCLLTCLWFAYLSGLLGLNVPDVFVCIDAYLVGGLFMVIWVFVCVCSGLFVFALFVGWLHWLDWVVLLFGGWWLMIVCLVELGR